MIGVDLINENGPVLAAVPSQVPLSVAVNVEPPYHTPALVAVRDENGQADYIVALDASSAKGMTGLEFDFLLDGQVGVVGGFEGAFQ